MDPISLSTAVITAGNAAKAVRDGMVWVGSLFGESGTWRFRISPRVLFNHHQIVQPPKSGECVSIRYTIHLHYSGNKHGPALSGIVVQLVPVADADSKKATKPHLFVTESYYPSQTHIDVLDQAMRVAHINIGQQAIGGTYAAALSQQLAMSVYERSAADPWLVPPNQSIEIAGVAEAASPVPFKDFEGMNCRLEFYGQFSTLQDGVVASMKIGYLEVGPDDFITWRHRERYAIGRVGGEQP